MLAVVGLRWPWLLAWPLAAGIGLLGLSLLARYLQTRRRTKEPAARREEHEESATPP